MPGLNTTIIGHQSLNSSKAEKSEKWPWRRWFRKRKTTQSSSQLVPSEDAVVVGINYPNHLSHQPAAVQRTRDVVANMEDIVQDESVCLLCLQLPNKWFTLQMCGCRFCLQCMEMYAHCSVRSGNIPIGCPDAHCRLNQPGTSSLSQLTRNEVRQLVPNDMFPLYLRLQLNTEVAVDPKLLWCPRPGCETVCTLNDQQVVDAASSKKKKSQQGRGKTFFSMLSSSGHNHQRINNQEVVCTTCRYAFCSQCKLDWHVDSPCPSSSQNRLLSDKKSPHDIDDPIALLERDGHVKRCPFCQVPIERDDGCAQMMCKNCRHVFCWFCLASLDDDFMLRHYDSGPCRSRLGHSRISVVWHRTQVVSAFLGLGVLFLVTSPLLLLASPCFLCWRHRNSQNKEPRSRTHVIDSSTTTIGASSQEHL